jgi:hypothetical protein
MMRLKLSGCAMITVMVLATVGHAEDAPASSQSDSLIREEFATDGTGTTLQSARGAFLEVDVAKAGEQIRAAAKKLREGAATVAEESRTALHDAAHDLDNLAVRVEGRSIASIQEFDKRVARAFHSLAQHHVQDGRVAWQAREPRLTGRRLRAAADNFETGVRLSGQRVGDATEETIRDARLISAKLIEGSGYAVDDVGRVFERLGAEVENLGAQMEPVPRKYPDRLVIPK